MGHCKYVDHHAGWIHNSYLWRIPRVTRTTSFGWWDAHMLQTILECGSIMRSGHVFELLILSSTKSILGKIDCMPWDVLQGFIFCDVMKDMELQQIWHYFCPFMSPTYKVPSM
eukprot:Gb_19310 [translate_table: standard]